jgi:hypothetical protein
MLSQWLTHLYKVRQRERGEGTPGVEVTIRAAYTYHYHQRCLSTIMLRQENSSIDTQMNGLPFDWGHRPRSSLKQACADFQPQRTFSIVSDEGPYLVSLGYNSTNEAPQITLVCPDTSLPENDRTILSVVNRSVCLDIPASQKLDLLLEQVRDTLTQLGSSDLHEKEDTAGADFNRSVYEKLLQDVVDDIPGRRALDDAFVARINRQLEEGLHVFPPTHVYKPYTKQIKACLKEQGEKGEDHEQFVWLLASAIATDEATDNRKKRLVQRLVEARLYRLEFDRLSKTSALMK